MGRERHLWQTQLRRILGEALVVPKPQNGSATASSAEFAQYADRLVVSVHPTRGTGSLEWVDVTSHPATTLQQYRNALASLMLEQGIPDVLAQTTMESVVLPQTATLEHITAVIVRLAANALDAEKDSIQELTNRLTMFFTPKRVFTIHRVGYPFLVEFSRRWMTVPRTHATPAQILHLVLREATRSFRVALSKSMLEFDDLERGIFIPDSERPALVRKIYHIKRRVAVYSRVLSITASTYDEMAVALGIQPKDPLQLEARQDFAHIRAMADEMGENANTMLQLLFQLSTYQLNELIRILTVFSAFFIPLGFIASVLGMNIRLPDTLASDPMGWWYCLLTMIAVGAAIAVWFRFKGFC